MRRFLGALLFAAVALSVSGCGDPAPTTATSIPDAVLTTDTLSGALTPGASMYHLVTARSGEVVMTMKGISDPSLSLGMEIGVYSTLSCTAVVGNPAATIGNSVVGLTTSQTQLCIRVYDPGTIPADASVAYEITLSHY
jgi:hypothetical protein